MYIKKKGRTKENFSWNFNRKQQKKNRLANKKKFAFSTKEKDSFSNFFFSVSDLIHQ